MNTASLENCKRLYELSGWRGTEHIEFAETKRDTEYGDLPEEQSVPAYDSGYLLRKLPAVVNKHCFPTIWRDSNTKWGASYEDGLYEVLADTPEDALCLLAIKLFEEGILK